jgi:hypothetical protein
MCFVFCTHWTHSDVICTVLWLDAEQEGSYRRADSALGEAGGFVDDWLKQKYELKSKIIELWNNKE